MAKYLKKFENHSAYEAAESSLILPNVSLCVTEGDVHYGQYTPPPPQPSNIITYEASSKLAETTSAWDVGLHTNAFNTTITNHTFENGVGTIEFAEDVTSIGTYAFFYCTGITNVVIPDGVTNIDDNAFSNCINFSNIVIPRSVTSITQNSFGNISGLTTIVVDSNNAVYDSRNNCNAIIETSTNTLIRGSKNTIIPNSVTSIGNFALNALSGLTNITVPDSVTILNNYAIANCPNLTAITIGTGATSFGNYCFVNCSGLTSITINATTPPSLFSTNVFENTNDCIIYVPSDSVNTYKSTTVWNAYSNRIQAIS